MPVHAQPSALRSPFIRRSAPALEACPEPIFCAQACAIDVIHAHLLQLHEHNSQLDNPLLTAAGVSQLRDWIVMVATFLGGQCNWSSRDGGMLDGNQLVPRWDPKARQLWLSTRLLKTFRQPAPNQTKILDVFHEDQWAKNHIDDPLPRAPGESEADARRRLHETIKNLNRGLPAGTIRFRGDGTGEGIRWEYHTEQTSDAASRKRNLDHQRLTQPNHPNRGQHVIQVAIDIDGAGSLASETVCGHFRFAAGCQELG